MCIRDSPNPLQEAQTKKILVDEGFTSRAAVVAEMGDVYKRQIRGRSCRHIADRAEFYREFYSGLKNTYKNPYVKRHTS